MLKTGKRLKHKRRYSEEFKSKIVEDFEKGTMSVHQMERYYGVSNATIYSWIYKYSTYNEKNLSIVEMKDSQSNKIKELEEKVKALEQAVGQKQMNIDFLEKMIDLAKEEYDIDIKKNLDTPRSGGSKRTKKK